MAGGPRDDLSGRSAPARTLVSSALLHASVAAYEEHRRRIYGLALLHLRDAAAAEDAVQETFVRAAPHLAQLAGDRAAAYLATTCRNICLDELRRRGRDRRVAERDWTAPAGNDVSEIAVLRRTVGWLWARLTDRERALFLYRVAGLSHEEIAERFGISAGAVRIALLRARRRARRLLDRTAAGVAVLLRGRRSRPRIRHGGAGLPAAPQLLLRLAAVATAGSVFTVGIAASRSALDAGSAGRPVSAPVPRTPGSAGLDDVQVTGLVASPSFARDRTVFAVGQRQPGCRDNGCAVLYRSSDGGGSWRALRATGFRGGRLLLPPSYPADATLLAAGPDGLQRSDDGGDSFRTVAATTGGTSIDHASPPAVPGAAGRVLSASGGHLDEIGVGGGPVRTLWSGHDAVIQAVATLPAPTGGLEVLMDVTSVASGGEMLLRLRQDTPGAPLRTEVAVPLAAPMAALLALPSGSLIAAPQMPDASGRWGLRCSTDGGRRWAAICGGR